MTGDEHVLLRELAPLMLGEQREEENFFAGSPTLIAVESGAGILFIDGTRIDLYPGTAVLAEYGMKIGLRRVPPGDLRLYRISFDRYRLSLEGRGQLVYQDDNDSLPSAGMVHSGLPRRAFSLMRELAAGEMRETLHGEPPLTRQRDWLELFQLLFSSVPRREEDREESAVERAVRRIDAEYARKLSREELAEEAGYHPHYFSRLFRQKTGLSLSDYILRVRMEKAKELLMLSGLGMSEIAARVGYPDGLYFSRKFKQATGCHPTEFRRRPKRIAALQFAGALLALGLAPEAVERRTADYSVQLAEELNGTARIDESDPEALARLKPDLIVAPAYLKRERLETLRRIAPTIVHPWMDSDPVRQLEHLAAKLGRTAEAAAWIADFRRRAAESRAEVASVFPPGETAAFYEIAFGNLYVLDQGVRGAYVLHEALGLPAPERVHREVIVPGRYKRIAPERFADYAADHMFLTVYAEDGDRDGERLLDSPEWRALPAVREGRTYPVPLERFWFNDGLSILRQLDWLTERLLERFDSSRLSKSTPKK
ncbi:AraC family transcriptional regulator [Saccharibacillus alkalitolerans]|uniref:AraC family transcriptional regulator n=1 Tax=Saccharibacillus alkalitolerans TaxID=2705290 RepID=A0ABX0F3V8_9BACL|nr:AraC family transcriptional regulator [Saccharibacillus alkalitolerans]NGZ75631.1 AraC family transcriptional regulator [Saccharibacillus alkalitolerans]